MPWPIIVMLSFEALVLLAVFIVIIYLIVRRIEDKKKENFEKRDN